jgi:hypothetical protein
MKEGLLKLCVVQLKVYVLSLSFKRPKECNQVSFYSPKKNIIFLCSINDRPANTPSLLEVVFAGQYERIFKKQG